jgi:hypothetical protein
VIVHQSSPLREIPVENRLDDGNWVLPGAVGSVERRFLGWVQLRLSDGRRGWLREETTIAVWGGEITSGYGSMGFSIGAVTPRRK